MELDIPVFLFDRYKKTPDHVQNARCAIGRAGMACPAWLTSDDYASMVRTYQKCLSATRSTGVQHHVDHIIPLNGLIVCGLHVPANLQVLSALDNIVKSNWHTP